MAFLASRRGVMVVLSLTIAAAAAVRLSHLDSSRVNGEHQYGYALIARLAFLRATDSIPAWRKDVAAVAVGRQRIFEPPIFPYLTSLGYRLIDRETLAVPRLMATCAWLLGGVILFLLAKRLSTASGGLLAAAYFLFVPSGVQASVSFLPESPMIMVMVASLLAIVWFFERSSIARFVIAGIISAAAIVIKPVSLFPIVGGVAGLALQGGLANGWPKRAWPGAALAVLVSVSGSAYYLRGILGGDDLAAHAGVSFIPGLLLEPSYWQGWLASASWAVGLVPLVLGMLALGSMPRGRFRALLLGLWGGYVAYCLIFTYHIRFAGHYHLTLVPIIALSLAPVAAPSLRFVRSVCRTGFGASICAAACLLIVWSSLGAVARTVDSGPRFESRGTAAEIGELVDHSTNTVFLSPYYGAPLEYFGELSGRWWPRSRSDPALRRAGDAERTVAERLDALDFTPDYFIITDRDALRTHEAELEALLAQRCTLLAENPGYLIYDLRGCIDRLGGRIGRRDPAGSAAAAVDQSIGRHASLGPERDERVEPRGPPRR